MIFYFSGAGNSYSVAKKIAEHLNDTKLIPLTKFDDFKLCQNEERIGIAFPCYCGTAPRAVLEFKKKLFRAVDTSNIYIFVVITYNHSDVGAFADFKDNIDAWFRVRMPQSDMYNSKPNSPNVIKRLLYSSEIKTKGFSDAIINKEKMKMYKNIPGLEAISGFANKTFMYKNMGEKLYADSNCNKCQQCIKYCPVRNITFESEPIWHNKCESCFGCVNRCSKGAIQVGDKTKGKDRYINPDFKNVYYSQRT